MRLDTLFAKRQTYLFLLTGLPEAVIFLFRSAPAVGAFIGFRRFFSPIAGG
jgi:hypothetical protein